MVLDVGEGAGEDVRVHGVNSSVGPDRRTDAHAEGHDRFDKVPCGVRDLLGGLFSRTRTRPLIRVHGIPDLKWLEIVR